MVGIRPQQPQPAVPSVAVSREITLVTDRFPGRPDLDAAVSRVMLHRVAAGDLPETLRLYVPDRLVAFSGRDAVNPGFATARSAAGTAGFGCFTRLAGGTAAVFHEETIAISWAIPDPDPRPGIRRRFEETAGLVRDSLIRLGVDAAVGEVPGEYCPGGSSVNARRRAKLAGIGQRLIAGAAHIGGVIVVGRPDLVNRALTPVYAALRYPWDPEATGAVYTETGAGVQAVLDAVVRTLGERHVVRPGPTDRATMEMAAAALAPPLA